MLTVLLRQLGLTFAYFCYPEPSGLSMEETAELFIDGFGVKKARAMHKARDAVIKEHRLNEKMEKA
jgi:SP family myo-inositol transporter-like MFS transporter 13